VVRKLLIAKSGREGNAGKLPVEKEAYLLTSFNGEYRSESRGLLRNRRPDNHVATADFEEMLKQDTRRSEIYQTVIQALARQPRELRRILNP